MSDRSEPTEDLAPRFVLRDKDGNVVSKPVAMDEDGCVTFGPDDVFYEVPTFVNRWASDDDEGRP